MSKPHVCPKCKGQRSPQCHPCGGRGIVWEPSEGEKLVDAIGRLLPLTPQVPAIEPHYPNPGDVPPVEPYLPPTPGVVPADPLNPWIVGPVVQWGPIPESRTNGTQTRIHVQVDPSYSSQRIEQVIRNALAQGGFHGPS